MLFENEAEEMLVQNSYDSYTHEDTLSALKNQGKYNENHLRNNDAFRAFLVFDSTD